MGNTRSINISIKVEIFTLFLCFFLGFSNTLLGQQNIISSENKEYLKRTVLYLGGNSGNTLKVFMDKVGFTIPKHISSHQWNQFPILRQIEMMVISAENKNKGIGGRNLLSELAKFQAQTYESISFDPRLKPLLEIETPKNIEFKRLRKKYRIDLPQPIKNQIATLSKYLSSNALGGPQTVLNYYFGLSDDAIYEIIATSKNYNEVYERGLAKSKVPPPHQQRLSDVSTALQNNFESAFDDAKLTEIKNQNSKNSTLSNRPNQIESATKDLSNKKNFNLSSPANRKSLAKNRFTSYQKKTFENRKISTVFIDLIKTSSGPGGVVMGNEVIDKTNLPNIKQILFFEDRFTAIDSLQTGNLEFIFTDDTSITIPNLYKEDIAAAYNLLYKTENNYVNGEAITLVSMDSFLLADSLRRAEITLNPEITDTRLGWSTLLCDAYPLAKKDFLENFKNESNTVIIDSLFKSFKGTTTYKIIDVPLEVSLNDNKIELTRNDKPQDQIINGVYLTMQSYDCQGLKNCPGYENPFFYIAMPYISNNIIEFYRLNKFAKTLALLRWAKEKNGDIVNLPNKQSSKFYTPFSLFIKSDEFKNLTLIEEIDFFKDLHTNIIDFKKYDIEKHENDQIHIYDYEFLKIHIEQYKKFTTKNDKNWDEVIEYIEQMTSEKPEVLNYDSIFNRNDYEVYLLTNVPFFCNGINFNYGLTKKQIEEREKECKRISDLRRNDFKNFKSSIDRKYKQYIEIEQNFKRLLLELYEN